MVSESQCNRATFVSDVSIPDNTVLRLSEPFTKTWRIKNSGNCTWSTGYKLVFAGGNQMGSPDVPALPINVAPSQTVDVSVDLVAPNAAAHYQGNWLLQSADGKSFGVGDTASDRIWVKVRVVARMPSARSRARLQRPPRG